MTRLQENIHSDRAYPSFISKTQRLDYDSLNDDEKRIYSNWRTHGASHIMALNECRR
jgi:hypothetical protein